MRTASQDTRKSASVIREQVEKGLTCKIKGCNNPLTHFNGPGKDSCCRKHQVNQREYGGTGRLDRPHTFHRGWVCVECGLDVLELPQLQDITDEMVKRRVARMLIHGDHQILASDGGDDSEQNVRCLCVICHAKKTILNKDYLNNRAKPLDTALKS